MVSGVGGIVLKDSYIEATFESFSTLTVSKAADANRGEFYVQVEYSVDTKKIDLASQKTYVDVIGKDTNSFRCTLWKLLMTHSPITIVMCYIIVIYLDPYSPKKLKKF